MGAIASRGVSFHNHYIASAMCSPSRAALLTGQPPQVISVFDQMEYPYMTSLSPDLPNMGSVLKSLGYKTAYFGKFEMDKSILEVEADDQLQRGRSSPTDLTSSVRVGISAAAPQSGFDNDRLTSPAKRPLAARKRR